ncbi:LysR family transcriptional regulator [Phenylobacterium sp.]|uniref:LysR family transcriptional regulator n=1 Tax=Phenylobacterium sp. TaxID=1871053 RepID=UPI002C3667D2|nr:LysR family transcriptional regulator [Phenylobacterium sp.]HVI34172.1 LysR family transcriptional regulator [Phenylobacterium sp.]
MARLDLDALEAFAAVARHRSFRRAAMERGVSASTLSQALRDLEAAMGVRVLNRTTRSVAPTPAGERLLARLGPALQEIGSALEEVRSEQDRPSGALRINAPEPAVELVLAPLVAGFLEAYPDVRLEITAESNLVDIVAKGYDAGVRWGEHLAQDMVAVPLAGQQHYVVVAAPSVLERHGTPEHPRDLLGKPCVRVRYLSGAEPPWEFERRGEVLRISPEGPLIANNVALLLRAAVDGVGFAMAFRDHAESHLHAGRLVSVLEEWCDPFPGPYLYYPSRRHPPSALRAFVDYVQARRRREG